MTRQQRSTSDRTVIAHDENSQREWSRLKEAHAAAVKAYDALPKAVSFDEARGQVLERRQQVADAIGTYPAPSLAVLAEKLKLLEREYGSWGCVKEVESIAADISRLAQAEEAADRQSACIDSAAWDQRQQRFIGLETLFQTDERHGPLYQANLAFEQAAEAYRRGTVTLAELDAAGEAQLAALEGHMTRYYEPAVRAAQAVYATPAPDMDAVLFKRDLLERWDCEEGEPLEIIEADVRRLLGEEA